MNAFTAPSALFSEIRDLDTLLLDLVASSPPSAWHWPSLYMLYVDIDRMAWQIRTAHGCFEQPLQDRPRFPLAEQVAGFNDNLALLDERRRAIVHGLWHLSRTIDKVSHNEAALLRLKAHVHPKSEWYQAMTQRGRSPGVSADGKILERNVLLTDPGTRARIDDAQGLGLVQRQRFDLSTGDAMAALADAVRAVEGHHATLNAALSACLARHCTIEDLLHPCSR